MVEDSVDLEWLRQEGKDEGVYEERTRWLAKVEQIKEAARFSSEGPQWLGLHRALQILTQDEP